MFEKKKKKLNMEAWGKKISVVVWTRHKNLVLLARSALAGQGKNNR